MVIEKESNSKPSSLTYIIQNIVVKGNLNPSMKFNLNLQDISSRMENTEYNKNRFPGLFFRFSLPKCVIIIFRNGNLILTGLKTFSSIKTIFSILISQLKTIVSIEIDKNNLKWEIVNIVITANFYDKINLDAAIIKLKNVIFEPEIFPALIYKTYTPVKCVFLVFNNGKVVLTGLRKKDLIEPTLINFGKLIRKKQLFLKE
jgi:transcription initiation factor TFIID TATA-box-binding protein